ncbi:hypothetical protein L9F63_025449, partial [Diploptera punctata]
RLFTAAPPLAMGLFDKVCSAETMLKYPALYKPSQNADLFNVKVFWVWIINSLGHSVLLYWLPLLAAEKDVIWSNGREGGYLLLGNIVYSYVVVTVCLKAGLVTNAWTWMTHLAIWGSIVTWLSSLSCTANLVESFPVQADEAIIVFLLCCWNISEMMPDVGLPSLFFYLAFPNVLKVFNSLIKENNSRKLLIILKYNKFQKNFKKFNITLAQMVKSLIITNKKDCKKSGIYQIS